MITVIKPMNSYEGNLKVKGIGVQLSATSCNDMWEEQE